MRFIHQCLNLLVTSIEMTNKTKRCRNCLENKGLDAFHNDKRTPDGRYDVCRDCRSKHRNITDIPKEDYEALLQAQNYSCAICGVNAEESKNGLAVDHNHATDQVRGLLCVRCNVGLGYFKDNINSLNEAVNYLLKSDDVT